MEIRIEITLQGAKTVVGNILKENVAKIKDYMKKNDIEKLSDFYGSSKGPDSIGVSQWDKNNDLLCLSGPTDESEIKIYENSDLFIHEMIGGLKNGDVRCKYNTEEINIILPKSDTHDLFFGAEMTEHGLWRVEFEIPDNFEFEIHKLEITERSIILPDNSIEIYDKLIYDGQEYEIELVYSRVEKMYIDITEHGEV